MARKALFVALLLACLVATPSVSAQPARAQAPAVAPRIMKQCKVMPFADIRSVIGPLSNTVAFWQRWDSRPPGDLWFCQAVGRKTTVTVSAWCNLPPLVAAKMFYQYSHNLGRGGGLDWKMTRVSGYPAAATYHDADALDGPERGLVVRKGSSIIYVIGSLPIANRQLLQLTKKALSYNCD